jgi:selT/selW/selH-like putative selenoprotein
VEAEIRQAFPSAQVKLNRGGGGVFNVHVDGELIYSKQTIHCGQFPDDGVVTQLIQDACIKG